MAFSGSRRGGRWDDRWAKFPASKPLATTEGIATSKARGAMAATWWSKRFVDVLESYGLGGRMTRGRSYARSGQVLSLDVTAGLVVAQVQGSRRVPYAVTVRLSPPGPKQWVKIDDLLRARAGYAAAMLAGEVPEDLEALFDEAGASLFPSKWSDLRATCSCPDWGDPCKHQAAVLYVFADRLDADPWLLLAWHGRSKDEVLALFAASGAEATDVEDVAPWWPLRPGVGPSDLAVGPGDPAIAEAADAVLSRLAESASDGLSPAADATLNATLAPAYEAMRTLDR